MSTIGTKLCQHRLAAKLTQQAIAERLGVKTNTYGSWEADHTSPSGRYFPELAIIFGVTIDKLFPDNNGNLPGKTNATAQKMDENEALKLVLQRKEEVIAAKEEIITAQLAQIEKLQEELENYKAAQGI
ncbi:helix-turn-helix transcriptional regulator [Runella salmonicolor]|uniref:Helix-turn-helix transcriptional regulator n=1 Tax=Runella salmonicolor TaxID=2950278 RepID=A0ABT1FNL4_9BACT|nr:helix-turn-helix transcriptional regulator [Runella salmonicolor]MCP1383090.1 helix-turn-helix transcriptional regulator [Runella salmonicolor]